MTHTRTAWGLGGVGGVLVALVCLGTTVDATVDPPDIFPMALFSEREPSHELPAEWRLNPLASAYDETQFDLVRSERGVVLRARSDTAGASVGIFRTVDLSEYPILEWRWKVNSLVEGGKADVKSRSDLPARLYVTFEHELSLRNRLKVVVFRAMGFEAVGKRSIGYVWANRIEKGRVFTDPYVDWHRLLPVESGTTHVGRWRTERRNVRADYRRIFGENPPPVKSIGILTDTEQTNGSVTAYYGDILFRKTVPDSATVERLPPGNRN